MIKENSFDRMSNQIVKVGKRKYPLVSIIVLTYNQQEFLRPCLKSILKQDYPYLELIVCDDASQDFDVEKTIKLIEELKQPNLKNYVVFQQEENVGTTSNAMKGIALSSGKIFKLHAGDDMLYKSSTVSSIARRFLRDENIRIIAGRSVACTQEGVLTTDYYPSVQSIQKMQSSNCVGQFNLLSTQAWCEHINAPAVFWTRELYDEIGGFDAEYKFTEDWPTWLLITQRGTKITCIDDTVTIYRYGGISNSLSNINETLGIQHYEECVRMLENISIPELQKNRDKKNLKKCRHCTEAIRARIVSEFEWEYMSYYDRLMWKVKHLRFLLQSKFYRQHASGFKIKYDNRTLVTLLLVLLLFYFAQQIPEMRLLTTLISAVVLLYFWLYKKKTSPSLNAVYTLCFLFYGIQVRILPIHNASLLWAVLFAVAAGGYVLLRLVSCVMTVSLSLKERRDL